MRLRDYSYWTGEDSRNYRGQHPTNSMVSAAKFRAKKLGIPFNIEPSDIEIPEICPYLKVPLVLGTMYAPSLDRVIPELGYTKGNVEVISRKANMMKSNASTKELLEFAYEILERN